MEIKYAVIILNYNTIKDAIAAADSVKNNSLTDSYVVCIADNCSSKELDRETCREYKSDHVISVCLDKNAGYARGNNQAIRYVQKTYSPNYIVIMNPDVVIMEKGTIEKMIDRIQQAGNDIVGGQPLVWNCYYSDNPKTQQNIRRVPDYRDLCMLSLLPLKAIERKRYQRMTYADQMPYTKEIQYRVPSGAFFIIKADYFDSIGLLDENTFLYYEEHILGKKLENTNKEFLFMPQYLVRHEHGKSTGSNHYNIDRFSNKCELNSKLYYAKEYLKCSKANLRTIRLLSNINIIFEYLYMFYNRMRMK